MTTTTQPVSSIQHNGSQAISAEEQSLGVALPQSWIVEWSGQKGREIMHAAVTAAAPALIRDVAGVIVEYLRKSDIFGLERLQEAAAGPEELPRVEKIEKGARELAKLIGEYAPEAPLPLDIDDQMQAPLSNYFGAEALRAFHECRTSQHMPLISRMTELYSLYWGPARMTPNIAEQLGKKHGAWFGHFWNSARQEYGNTPTSADCWIAFPNDVFGRIKTVQEQEALIPAGFEFPHVQDAVFCVFVRFGCTGVRIMSQAPWTYTRCQEETQGHKLVVGGFGAGGLYVDVSHYVSVSSGVAPLRKFCIGH